ncbi:methyl-accepting chemotaxis protein [Marinobacter sp. X15-166B]|uniref:methyl-accepting chemotaxis protein n=1 Tax=Marinobacter sp. X15-166B TaxID=1897620 RepID=UPI00085C256D|nr:methyl-accepting chemotaxis protein [Marinobacter sp. X15-166B]OEY67597.1 chemotaxis protein [Marinobacter sp. X15-166B]
MQLTFGQKLLSAFGILLVLIMGVFTAVGDARLEDTSDTYIDAQIADAVAQNANSIAQWLNTRLEMTVAAAEAVGNVATDEEARNILRAMTAGGGFLEVYIGDKSGQMLMQSEAVEATLPPGYDPRKRGWYQQTVNSDKATFTEPYLDAQINELLITAVVPVKSRRYQGVAGGDISMAAIDEMLSATSFSGTGYLGLVNSRGVVLFHPDRSLIGENVSTLTGMTPNFDGNRQYYQHDGENWRVAFHPIRNAEGVDWYLGTFVSDDKISAPMESARRTGLIIAVIALLISLVILHVGIKVLMAPIRRLGVAMADISAGEADLTQRLDDKATDEFGELARDFNRFIENIQNVVRDVQSGSEELKTNVVSLRDTAGASRQNVENQQAEVDMVATAINEMSAAATEIAQSAQQTADAANTADDESRASLDTVTHSRDAVQQLAREIHGATDVINNLGEDVSSITTVLEVIQGIAEQTNLLALNAAIEAARAGDAGRGFAVVADEVRNLAQRTQTSTEEINSMIERLQKGAEDAVNVMKASTAVSNVSMEKAQDAMEALDRVAEAITSISQMTSQIATASEEQTAVTEELNASITRIADQGQEAAAAASENDVYSGHIAAIGQTLNDNVSRFRV